MNFVLHWVNSKLLAAKLATNEPPAVYLARPFLSGRTDKRGGVFANAELRRTGTYYVPITDGMTKPLDWSVINKGDSVRVPLHGYRTLSQSRPLIMALGLEHGIKLGMSLIAKAGRAPDEVILAARDEVEAVTTDGATGYLCVFGFAFKYNE
jgi:hypothetical protein